MTPSVSGLRGVHRNHQFDILRIVFATLVLLSHAPELTDGNRSRELFTRLTRSDVSFGILGVDGFFLLSGYLIVRSWQHDPEFMNFVRKRVLRIVPGYLVAALLSTLVVGLAAPGIPHFFAHLDRHFVKSLLALSSPSTPPVFPGRPDALVNGALWTIAFEFRCYLLVAFCGICGVFRKPILWFVATAGFLVFLGAPRMLACLHWSKLATSLVGDPDSAFRLTAVFLVGGCFWLFRRRIVFRPWIAAIAAVLFVAACATAPAYTELALVLCGGYVLFDIGQLQMRSLDWMKRMPDISYGIYLYGWPVESLWVWYHHGSPWVTFLVSTVACFGLGWLSWDFVERPMLKLKRRATAPLPAP